MCSLHLTHPRAHTPGAVDTHTHTWSSGHTHTHTWSSGHTHTHTWSSGHTHTHTPGADGQPHTHTHLEQWTHTHTPGRVDTTTTHTTHNHTLEQWTHTHTPHTHTNTHMEAVGSQPAASGSSGGSVAFAQGLTSVVDIPAGAENPQPQITSPALYPLGHDCTSIITYSYTVLLHIQCGSVKSNAILIKIHKHISHTHLHLKFLQMSDFFSEI